MRRARRRRSSERAMTRAKASGSKRGPAKPGRGKTGSAKAADTADDGGAALTLLETLLAKAKRAGADAADALYVESAALSHMQRLGKVEKLERAESRDLGLRVFVGTRQAIVSSSEIDAKALDGLGERALAMARAVPEDPYCGLAPEARLATAIPDLDLCDPAEPAPEALMERASACEAAARAVPG